MTAFTDRSDALPNPISGREISEGQPLVFVSGLYSCLASDCKLANLPMQISCMYKSASLPMQAQQRIRTGQFVSVDPLAAADSLVPIL